MAVVRSILIGMIVAILGFAAALGVGYPAGAKPAKGHHTQCAKAGKSKAKRGKSRRKCKKAPKTTHGQKSRGQHAALPAVPLPAAPTPATPTPAPAPPTTTAPPPPTPPTPTATPPPPEAPPEVASAMLTVYAYTLGGSFGRHLVEGELVRITRLGAGEEALGTIETDEYIVHVVPGRYKVTAGGGFESASTQVEVTAGQELVVTLYIPTLYIPPPPRQTEEKGAR